MTTFVYEDLAIGFTTSFRLMWNDQGSGGIHDGAFWRPIASEDMAGFYPLGDLGIKGYSDVNGKSAIAMVKDAKGSSGTALRPPTKFEQIWNDKGSGAKRDGSMWRPIPPDGYVALGLICNSGYSAPSLDVVRCVREDLVVPAIPGDLIWDDTRTGVRKDFGSWQINAPDAPEAGKVNLSAGTFIGAASHTKPGIDPNAYALCLKILQDIPSSPLPAPILKGFSRPSPFERDTVSCLSTLPWFAVKDPILPPVSQLMKSPQYRLERVDRYKCIDFGYNQTSVDQKLTWSYGEGVHGGKSKEFSETTTIELGAEWKIKEVFSVSAKLSQSFTYTETTTQGWERMTENQVEIVVPPGKAVAAYLIQSTYRLFRADGTQLSAAVDYDVGKSFVWSEYPSPEKESRVKFTLVATK
jgi:hypothetical protein